MCYKGTAEQAAEPLSRAGLDVLTPAPPPGPPPSHRLIHDAEEMGQLGELGVLFLLFEMGLELSLDRLKVRRVHTWGGGGAVLGEGVLCACVRPPCLPTVGPRAERQSHARHAYVVMRMVSTPRGHRSAYSWL